MQRLVRHKARLRRLKSLFDLELDDAFACVTELHRLVEAIDAKKGIRNLRHRLRLCVARAGTCVARLRGIAVPAVSNSRLLETLFDACQVAAAFVIVLDRAGALAGESNARLRSLLERLFDLFAVPSDVTVDVVRDAAPVVENMNVENDGVTPDDIARILLPLQWLLLRHAMQGAEAPNEVYGVNPDDDATGE